jgi:hypothetical protein
VRRAETHERDQRSRQAEGSSGAPRRARAPGESVAELSGDLDFESELRPIDGQLEAVGKAIQLLRDELSLVGLRAGHQVALPLHRKAIAHAPRLAAALAALDKVLKEVAVDVRAFDQVNDELAYAQAQHPTERAPYDATYTGSGAAQAAHLLHDWYPLFFREPDGSGQPGGVIKSRLDRWRDEARELGLRLEGAS